MNRHQEMQLSKFTLKNGAKRMAIDLIKHGDKLFIQETATSFATLASARIVPSRGRDQTYFPFYFLRTAPPDRLSVDVSLYDGDVRQS